LSITETIILAMEKTFAECVSNYHELGEPCMAKLEAIFVKKSYPARTKLTDTGAISDKIYFIAKGCISGQYKYKNQYHTLWFGVELDCVSCYKSLITGGPGVEILVCQEECVLYEASWPELKKLVESELHLSIFYHRIMESNYLYWENRILELQFNTAKERYELFVGRAAQMLQRFPLNQIASYLGITQETLSRIRAK
jgi:CRP-like cAMP-binding protein